MHFEYVPHPDWPPLAWLADCSRHGERITIHHGGRVETNAQWFAEAVWDDDYAEGAFDRTDLVFGSGGRLRDGACVFVSSASTVDRLDCFEGSDSALVSNSLPCLVEYLDANVDATYPRYYEDFHSVCKGLTKYERLVRTSRGAVELVYFDNLRWDGRSLRREDKPRPTRRFDDFASYSEFLLGAMRRISANMQHHGRALRYSMLGTLSTGYDSPTAAAIGRSAGLTEVLCFDRAHDGQADSGEAIAKCLDLRTLGGRDDAWREIADPEIPFISSNAMGEEVRFRSVESILGGRVLLTGYHGDKVWDLHTTKLGPDIVRGDPSGSSLCEYRLWAGFIHLPVPFLAVREIRQINAISRSEEMRPWDIGGQYSRPICRRIVESAGVPRTLFGVAKKNASVIIHNYDDFLTTSSRSDYLAWIRNNRMEWIKRGRLPPIASPRVDTLVHRASGGFAAWSKRAPLLWRLGQRVEGKPTPLRRHVFPWAVARAQERYRIR